MKAIATLVLSFWMTLLAMPLEAKEALFCDKIGGGLPPGTATLSNPDGSMVVDVPEGWFLLANINGRWQHTPTAVVRCHCESGSGGCSPAKFGGNVGCVMSTCSTCSKSGGAATLIPVRNDHIGVSFASREEVAQLPPVNGALMSIPEVVNALSNFRKQLGIRAEDKAARSVMVRIYGHIAPMELPESARLPSPRSAQGNLAAAFMVSNLVVVPTAAVKCSCESGGTCRKGSMLGATWCDASSCKTCSMSY